MRWRAASIFARIVFPVADTQRESMFLIECSAVCLIAGRRRLAQLTYGFQGIARDLVFQGKQPLTKEVEVLVVHIVCGPLAVRFHRVLPYVGST